jgi:tRNA A37 threonylcarbamoyladenosine biosynthesis protein TsaE
MDPNLYLVFSKPPDRVSPDEYDRWYQFHARENIESPGFLSTRRYALQPGGPNTNGSFRHLALYEYEGDYEPIRLNLEQRITDGDIVLPEWFGEIEFGSWRCEPIDVRAEPVRS